MPVEYPIRHHRLGARNYCELCSNDGRKMMLCCFFQGYEQGRKFEFRKSKSYVQWSVCCSVTAWISVLVGAGIITGIVFAAIAADNNSS